MVPLGAVVFGGAVASRGDAVVLVGDVVLRGAAASGWAVTFSAVGESDIADGACVTRVGDMVGNMVGDTVGGAVIRTIVPDPVKLPEELSPVGGGGSAGTGSDPPMHHPNSAIGSSSTGTIGCVFPMFPVVWEAPQWQ